MSDQSKKLGRYLVFFVFVLLLCPERVYAEDTERQAGTSMKEAAAIEEGVQYVSTLTDQNTIGWYRFTTRRQAGYYQLKFRNFGISDYVTAAIVGKNQEQLVSCGSDASTTNDVLIMLKANTTYYIKIRNTTNDHPDSGRFRVVVNFIGVDREGDTYDQAVRLTNRKTYTASQEAGNDEDWYKFTAATSGKYTVTIKKVDKQAFQWVEKQIVDGQGIKWTYMYDNSEIVSMVKGQTYYIKVRGGARSYPARYGVTVAKNIAPKTIQLNRSGTIYLQGDMRLWVKSFSPKNASPAVRWKSSNTDVVTAGGGRLHTWNTGTATVSAISVNDSSVRASVVIVVRPANASNIKVDQGTFGQLRLTWSTTPSVAAYEIYRAGSKNGAYTKVAVVPQSGSSYTDRNVTFGRRYYYKIRTYAHTVSEGKLMYSKFSKYVSGSVR